MLSSIGKQQQAKKQQPLFNISRQSIKIAAVAASVAVIASIFTYFIVVFADNTNENRYNTISRDLSHLRNEQERQKRFQLAIIDTINSKHKATDAPPADVRYTATGFAVTNDGYFLTAYHAINNGKGDADSIYISINQSEYYKANLVSYDAKADIALLKVEKRNFKFAKYDLPYTFANSKAPLATEIYSLGYPNEALKYSEGYVSSANGFDNNTHQYTLYLPALPGQSGSPVFNETGSVIGLITATGTVKEEQTYSIGSEAILHLLSGLPKKNKISLPTKSRLNKLSREQQIEKITPFLFEVNVYKR
ncbi:MAG: serine protease [Chitinophagia bacterium]|nr:serine protease [Chitinophagia bacterium]